MRNWGIVNWLKAKQWIGTKKNYWSWWKNWSFKKLTKLFFIFIDYNGDPIGPLRVWNKNIDIPGLAMTRCFGDKAGIPAGIISHPEIIKYSITPEQESVIVIASDGVFEFLNNLEVFSIIEPFLHTSSLKQASDKLV